MYVFGGYTNDGFAVNDLHKLCLLSLHWTRMALPGFSSRNPSQLVNADDTVCVPDSYFHTAVARKGIFLLV